MESEGLLIMPYVGAIVNYVLEDGPNKGQIRPAIIVRIWGSTPDSTCQLVSFMDGTNDQPAYRSDAPLTAWKTSCSQSLEPKQGYWHYPPIFQGIGEISELAIGDEEIHELKSFEDRIREVVQAELRRFEEDIRRSIARQLEDFQTAKENSLLDLKTQVQREIEDWSRNLTDRISSKGY